MNTPRPDSRMLILVVASLLVIAMPATSAWGQGAYFQWDVASVSGGDYTLTPGADGEVPDHLVFTDLIPDGGVEVTLELRLGDWGGVGDADLGAYQGTVDSSGYSNGDGAPLGPLGGCCPGDPSGMFIDPDHPDFVFGNLPPPCIPLPASILLNLNYELGCSVLGGCSVEDAGIDYYGGTLIIEVPENAAGNYSVGILSLQTKTFMNSGSAAPLLITGWIPVTITVPFDCNDNGVPDATDIAIGTSNDCDDDEVPDECQGPLADCNNNDVWDICDIVEGTSADCDDDSTPDECQDTSADCNGNGTWDACDLANDTSEDCNENQVPDECDLTIGTSDDCNLNTVPDECDVASETSEDCDGSGTPDECDIADGTLEDCNWNVRADACDISDGPSEDNNDNGIPDECEGGCSITSAPQPEVYTASCLTDEDCAGRTSCVGGVCYVPKNRYVSFIPNNPGAQVAYRVTHVGTGRSWWAGEPFEAAERPTTWIARLVQSPMGRVWSEPIVFVGDCGIVPAADFDVEAIAVGCDSLNEDHFSPALSLPTTPLPTPPPDKWWADVGGMHTDEHGWTPPDGVVNFDDIEAVIRVFEWAPSAPPWIWTDVADERPDAIVNMTDIQMVIFAFEGRTYPYRSPADCP